MLARQIRGCRSRIIHDYRNRKLSQRQAISNEALQFDRDRARGMRLDIAAGTAVRFEPGQERDVTLVPLSGRRQVYGFQQKIMGAL